MARNPGIEGFRAGDRVIVGGRPRVVLGASGTAIRFAGDDGTVEEAPVAEMVGSGRLRLQPRGTGGPKDAQIGLAALRRKRPSRPGGGRPTSSRSWTGPARTRLPGPPPRPAYDVERTSLGERELAKAAELSAQDRPVAASTVKHRRQRWEARGCPGWWTKG